MEATVIIQMRVTVAVTSAGVVDVVRVWMLKVCSWKEGNQNFLTDRIWDESDRKASERILRGSARRGERVTGLGRSKEYRF